MKTILSIPLLLLIINCSAQVVYTYPLFPTQSDDVTIYFDATQGNGALAGYTGTVYAHTGVVTTSGGTSWSYVQGNWGTADPEVLMTEVATDLYSISYNIEDFYGIPAGTTVYRLAFVFRNQDGSIVGRNADGSDIYYDLWDGASLQTNFLQPTSSPLFVNLNDPVEAVFITSKKADVSLYKNNDFVTSYTNTDSVGYTFTATENGTTWIKAVANDGITVVADSFYFVVNAPVVTADLPDGTVDGINYINDSTVTLVLVAPNKQYVYALGDFSNWQVQENLYMNRTTDGSRWWVTVSGLEPLKEYRYQFLVDGTLYLADPYCEKVLDPWNDGYISDATYPDLIEYPTGLASGLVSVLQTGQQPFNWQIPDFEKPDPDNLVVYELLIRDFISARNYPTLIDTFHYLKSLGITAIELMPFNEFEGNDSWGYNPSFYFAPDKYYGTKEKLKEFIDLCHQNGIAVIQDMVLNHSFSQSPLCQLYWDPVSFGPTADNPWYNPDQNPSSPGYQGKHPFGVGYDFNHESDYTKDFMDDVLAWWVTEYKVDGFRFDLSKGFTQKYSGDNVGLWGQYDQGRIDILKRMADKIRAVDPSVILILEHFADNSEEEVLSDYGFYLWGNLNYAYAQSAMGYSSGSDVGWINYKSRGWADPHVTGYMESHDEERLMYKTKTFGNGNASYSVKPLDSALNRMKLAALHFILIPGPKMIWQFGELGYDYSLTYGGSNVAAKPVRWDYLDYGPRVWLYNFYKALNEFKKNYALCKTTDFILLGAGLKKNLRLSSDTMNVMIIGNFDITGGSHYPYFQHTGWWYEYFTGDSMNVTDVDAQIFLEPGEYRMYVDRKLNQPDLGNVGVEETTAASILTIHGFPNPAAESVTLDFYVPEKGMTTLNLLDATGRLIQTVTQKELMPGWYTVDVNLNGMSPGIFHAVLANGSGQVQWPVVKY